MTKETEQKWRERVRDWRASGQSAEEFAREKPYEDSTLRWWASRLGRGDASAAAPRIVPVVTRVAAPCASAGAVRASMSSPTGSMSSPTAVSEVVVEIGAARLRVTRGVDDALLAQVVRALAAEAR